MQKLKILVSRAFSAVELIVIVSLFMALFANTAFFTSAAKAYQLDTENILFVISLFVFITGIFILTLSVLCQNFLIKPVLITFLLLSSLIAGFMNLYGVIIDYKMIDNVLETDLAEIRDLISTPLVLAVIFLGILPSVLIYFAKLTRPGWKEGAFSRLKLFGITACVMVALIFTFSAHYASLFRMQRALMAQINPTHAIFSLGKLVRHTIRSTSFPHMIVGADARIHKADVHKELVIMVVGETARADHFSLNGYERETNPLLKREKVINFPDFWSCATTTAQSVPCMFSHYTRAEFDRRKAKVADNVLDILNRAGVSVLWRDNNSSSKGVADRVTFEGFQSAASNPVCDTECRDEGMLVTLQDYIDKHSNGDILIVLHQMGNHGPAYYKRYPAAFEKFTPVCKTSDLGSCSSEEIINAYDNAILYTDYFLSRVIKLLKQNDNAFETAMIYASDHGESLGEKGLYLHAMPYFLAPDTQKHVPALMWVGKNFDHEYLVKMEKRRKKRLSHDNIFSTLLGLFEVRSDSYDLKLDILDHSQPESG